jgi:hypothetical protein
MYKKESLSTFLSQGLVKSEPLDSGTFWINRSQFLKTDVDGQYVWSNIVTYVRQYTRTDSSSISVTLELQKQYRVLVLPFLITWRARVMSDGRFREYSFLDSELKDNQFRAPSEEEKKIWNLESAKS